MTDVTSQPARGRRIRRFIVLLVLGGLVLLVAYGGMDLWAGHRVHLAVARLEKQYGRLSEDTLGVARAPDGDNRAHVVRAAAELIERESTANFPAAYNRLVHSDESARVPEELKSFVQVNRLALRVADEARARHQSNWDSNYSYGSGFNVSLLAIRYLANATYLEALMNLEAGRPEEAAKNVATGLAISGSLRQEPELVFQLFRIQITMDQCEAVHRLVMQSDPSKASLDDLARWLAENRTPDPGRVGIISEMKHVNAAFARLDNGNFQPEMATLLPLVWERARRVGTYNSPLWLGPLARLERPWIRLARARYLERVGDLLDVHSGPRPHPPFPSSPTPWPSGWLPYMLAGLERATDSFDRFHSTLSATELAVALRRFRIDHGSYPDGLSALAPTYIAMVPTDPFTGRPPVYTRQGAGFHLHAEGGQHVPTEMMSVLDWSVPK